MALETALVIDDNADLRETLRFILEDEGYLVLEAANGVEALATLRDHVGPLVVILDNDLPYLNGSYLLHMVAEDETLAREHRFVLMSAEADNLARPLRRDLSRLHARTLRK